MELIKLSELVDGADADCLAVLTERSVASKKDGSTYHRCRFRDKGLELEAVIWPNHAFANEVETWKIGEVYHLRARTRTDPKYGRKLEIHDIEPASISIPDAPRAEDFVESSRFSAHSLHERIDQLIARGITDPHLARLVAMLFERHGSVLDVMPAAQRMHHAYARGLLEHVWSMTRVAVYLGEHYARYYNDLRPPLNVSIVVTAAIVHDLGKLLELEQRPTGVAYSRAGILLGHIVIGRDMVRSVAREIEGFPEELLLQLEHAILAHHGKREFGSPVLPATIEALLVSYIDDLDAKMNAAARALLESRGEGDFTEKVYALDGRVLYRGGWVGPEPSGAEEEGSRGGGQAAEAVASSHDGG